MLATVEIREPVLRWWGLSREVRPDVALGGILASMFQIIRLLVATSLSAKLAVQMLFRRQVCCFTGRKFLLSRISISSQTQTFVQLSHQNQATVRRDSRSLEIDLQGSIKRELKRRPRVQTRINIGEDEHQKVHS